MFIIWKTSVVVYGLMTLKLDMAKAYDQDSVTLSWGQFGTYAVFTESNFLCYKMEVFVVLIKSYDEFFQPEDLRKETWFLLTFQFGGQGLVMSCSYGFWGEYFC